MGIIAFIDGKYPTSLSYFNGVTDPQYVKYINGQEFGSITAYQSFVSCTDSSQIMYNYIDSIHAWTASIIYNTEPDESWILSYTNSGAGGTSQVEFEVDTNPSNYSRYAVVRYEYGSFYIDITWCQDGYAETCT